jgi:hypothetical protein
MSPNPGLPERLGQRQEGGPDPLSKGPPAWLENGRRRRTYEVLVEPKPLSPVDCRRTSDGHPGQDPSKKCTLLPEGYGAVVKGAPDDQKYDVVNDILCIATATLAHDLNVAPRNLSTTLRHGE